MHQLIQIADQSEINALIIDIKDEFGLNYAPTDPSLQRNAGRAGTIPHLKELLDTLRAHKILAVARIVVFKDSVTARVHPEWTIRKADGTPWRDKKGMLWVNPYHHELWDYNIQRRRRRGEARLRRSAIRLHPLSRAVQVAPAAGLSRPERRDEGAGARRLPHDGARAPLEAWRAHDRRHLRAGDERAGRARGRPAVRAPRAGGRRAPPDGVPVALSAGSIST